MNMYRIYIYIYLKYFVMVCMCKRSIFIHLITEIETKLFLVKYNFPGSIFVDRTFLILSLLFSNCTTNYFSVLANILSKYIFYFFRSPLSNSDV